MFVVSPVATGVTGFFVPFVTLLRSYIVGAVLLLVLATVIATHFPRHLAGAWRRIYTAGVVRGKQLATLVVPTQTSLGSRLDTRLGTRQSADATVAPMSQPVASAIHGTGATFRRLLPSFVKSPIGGRFPAVGVN